MCSLERLKEIRALEFFLFGGIPEAPESMFERDSHHHAEVRRTRRGLATDPETFSSEPGTVVAVIEVDYATGDVILKHHDGNTPLEK